MKNVDNLQDIHILKINQKTDSVMNRLKVKFMIPDKDQQY